MTEHAPKDARFEGSSDEFLLEEVERETDPRAEDVLRDSETEVVPDVAGGMFGMTRGETIGAAVDLLGVLIGTISLFL